MIKITQILIWGWGRGRERIPMMFTLSTGYGPLPSCKARGERAPSILDHVLPSLDQITPQQATGLFREKKNQGSESAAHSTSQPLRSGRPERGLELRGPGNGLEGRAEQRWKRPGLAERPPRPLRLSSGPADGAWGANFAGEEEATQRVADCADAWGKERLSVRLPTSRTVSPSFCRVRVAPAHLRKGPGDRRGRRDGRYGTRPRFSRRVALARGAGRARPAGGAPASSGREVVGGSARAGNPLPAQSDRFSRSLLSYPWSESFMRRARIGSARLSIKCCAGRGANWGCSAVSERKG